MEQKKESKQTQYKNIMIKIGTATITNNYRLNYPWVEQKVNEIAEVLAHGSHISITSSGALASGMELMSLIKKPKDIHEQQLLCGVGQAKLTKTFKDAFKKKDITIMQVLLTHHNFNSVAELKNIQQVFKLAQEKNIVPLINENDVITNEEIRLNGHSRFTDNDILGALVAREIHCDLLLILTDVNGLYTLNPKTNTDAELIPEIKDITPEIKQKAEKGDAAAPGRGGMLSKIIAAEMVHNDMDVIIGFGGYSINDLILGKVPRTFISKRKK